jgi:hypothetical protein
MQNESRRRHDRSDRNSHALELKRLRGLLAAACTLTLSRDSRRSKSGMSLAAAGGLMARPKTQSTAPKRAARRR